MFSLERQDCQCDLIKPRCTHSCADAEPNSSGMARHRSVTATSPQRHRNVITPKNQGYNMQNEYREGTYITFSLKGIQNT